MRHVELGERGRAFLRETLSNERGLAHALVARIDSGEVFTRAPFTWDRDIVDFAAGGMMSPRDGDKALLQVIENRRMPSDVLLLQDASPVPADTLRGASNVIASGGVVYSYAGAWELDLHALDALIRHSTSFLRVLMLVRPGGDVLHRLKQNAISPEIVRAVSLLAVSGFNQEGHVYWAP